MSHLSEDELLLYYYGELAGPAGAEMHLGACPGCRERLGDLQRLLNLMDGMPSPEREADYEAQVWHRMSPALPASRPRLRVVLPWRWAAAGLAGCAALALALLFVRIQPHPAAPVRQAAGPQQSELVLRAALADYLDRSEIVLTELVNASPRGPYDISFEQQRAADLLDDSRIYRQTAVETGDTASAAVLDQIERVLLEITHAPSRIPPGQLAILQSRLQAESVLFKIRVAGANARQNL